MASRIINPTVNKISEVSIALGLIGPGTVGKAVLEHLRAQSPSLLRKYGLDFRVLGITNSRQMLLDKENVDLNTWGEQLIQQGEDASLGVLTEHLKASKASHKVIIDTTASSYIPQLYKRWMAQGIHVVSPNKRLTAGPLDEYLAVKQLQGEHKAHYMYEGTVGAGLPIISTLKTLLDTGDEVLRIEGVFSGTMSYIFNELSEETTFSQALWGARRRGYTEADPRDDISGMDVTRKVITLARECGAHVELRDINTENLIPEPLRAGVTLQEFMEQLPQYDDLIVPRLREAEERDMVLRYVGSYDAESGVCQVRLRMIPKPHPFAHLTTTENVFIFTTARYSHPPLIIRGPGAGAALTATGVFADLITLGRYLGAPS